jgi:hypothetical protein
MKKKLPVPACAHDSHLHPRRPDDGYFDGRHLSIAARSSGQRIALAKRLKNELSTRVFGDIITPGELRGSFWTFPCRFKEEGAKSERRGRRQMVTIWLHAGFIYW